MGRYGLFLSGFLVVTAVAVAVIARYRTNQSAGSEVIGREFALATSDSVTADPAQKEADVGVSDSLPPPLSPNA